MEFLDFWVTRDGIKSIFRRIETLQNMKPTTSQQKKLRRFIYVVSYYRDMWEIRSHMLAALTNIMPNKVKFKWTKNEQNSFGEIKQIVARDNLLTWLDFN